MKSYVEHVNITVSDIDDTIKFIQTAVPDFTVRNRWNADGFEWVHIGTDQTYLALMKPLELPNNTNAKHKHETERVGYNHVCIVVPSVAKVQEALLNGGFMRGFNNGEIISTQVRKSIYFHDPDDNEFEFMEYLTDDPKRRNSYKI